MNKIAIRLFCIAALYLSMIVLYGQDGICFRIVDTIHLNSRMIAFSGAGTSFFFIVNGDTQKKEVLYSALTCTSLPQEQLLLTTETDSRFFALLKIFSEDSLMNRFSDKEICKAFMHRKHPDSTERMKIPPISSPLRRIGDLVYLCNWNCSVASLLDIPEFSYTYKSIPLRITRQCKNIYRSKRRYHYKVADVTFDSWGIIVEFYMGCRECFFNDTQECDFFLLWPNETLRLFIPMSKERP